MGLHVISAIPHGFLFLVVFSSAKNDYSVRIAEKTQRYLIDKFYLSAKTDEMTVFAEIHCLFFCKKLGYIHNL